MSTSPHGAEAPHGASRDFEAPEIRLAPAQLADLVAGGITIVVPGGPSIRLVPDYAAGTVERSLVDADAVASAIGMSPAFVREHGAELGGQRMGDGPRPRWRFDLEQARRAWAARSTGERAVLADPASRARSSLRHAKASGNAVELLPIRDQGGSRRAA